jgi:hypothetical protein
MERFYVEVLRRVEDDGAKASVRYEPTGETREVVAGSLWEAGRQFFAALGSTGTDPHRTTRNLTVRIRRAGAA